MARRVRRCSSSAKLWPKYYAQVSSTLGASVRRSSASCHTAIAAIDLPDAVSVTAFLLLSTQSHRRRQQGAVRVPISDRWLCRTEYQELRNRRTTTTKPQRCPLL